MSGPNSKIDAKEISAEVKKDVKKSVKKFKKNFKAQYGKRYHKMLLGINPYLQALLDPWNVHGVKIPDMQSTGSSTFALAFRLTVQTNATGNCFICFGRGLTSAPSDIASLVPLAIPTGGGGTNYRIGFYNNDDACTPTNLTANTGGRPIVQLQFAQWNSQSNGVPSLFDKTRLVSAGVAVSAQSSGLANSGKISIVACPRWRTQDDTPSTQNLTYVEAQAGVRIVNLNQNAGASSHYVPIDPMSLNYCNVDNAISPSGAPDRKTFLSNAGCEFLIAVTGAGANVPIQLVLVCNYEGLPRYNQLDLGAVATPSPVDTMQLDSALNVAAQVPATYLGIDKAQGVVDGDHLPPRGGVASTYQATGSDSAKVQEQHANNPMGMLGTVLEQLPGFLEKGMEIGGKMAPMVESLAALL